MPAGAKGPNIPLHEPTVLEQIRQAFQTNTAAGIELALIAIWSNPEALKGRDPACMEAHELGDIIRAAMSQPVDLTGAPFSPFHCKRCGSLRGRVVEVDAEGERVKAFCSTLVAWSGKGAGRCVKCGKKIYFAP